MKCLFCHKELENSSKKKTRKKFCGLSCKGFYHRYKHLYPDGFPLGESKILISKSNRGRKPLDPEDKKYRIHIPIHNDDLTLYKNITNPKKFFYEEINVFLLSSGQDISNIIKSKHCIVSTRNNEYTNYTLYISYDLLTRLNSLANNEMRTRRNLLIIFSLYALTH